MIDLHAHVLPGVDDGPADSVGAVALAEVAAQEGVRVLAATPHLRADHPVVVPDEVAPRVDELNRVLAGHGVDLRVVPGAEVDLERAERLEDVDLRAVTLGGNGRDLLVETPYGAVGLELERGLGELAGRGFRLTLAHPERNPSLQAEPERLGRLVAAGILVQLTAGSLAGRRRSPSRRLALRALREGWVQAIASDAHGASWRPPRLRPGLDAAHRALPGFGDRLGWLVSDAPAAILEGRELPPPPAVAAAQGWRRSLRG
ncbi:MAG: phosphotransferase [Actinomycetota bacterium]|nr:phosphotransferase [Actinomycetota bacterium]